MLAFVIGSTSSIDGLIICQETREECSSLYYLKDVLTRYLFLLLDFLLINLGMQPLEPIYFSYTRL